MDDIIYFSRRAAEEVERATRAATTAAVRAHYQLSELYLDEIARLEARRTEVTVPASAPAAV